MIAVFQAEINRYQKEYNLKAYEASINTQNLEKVTTKLTDLEYYVQILFELIKSHLNY